MVHPLLAIPISIVFVVAAVAFGRRVLGMLRVKCSSSPEGTVFGAGIGLGVLAYLILAVGLARFLYTPVLLGVVVVMAVIGLPEIIRMVREVALSLKGNAGAKLGAGDSLLTLSAVVLGALALIPALAPPTSMDWDGLAYHLAVPKIFLQDHAIHYIPFTSHSNFPFLTEMLYTLGLAVKSVGVAKLFHFAIYLFTALGILSLGKRHLGSIAGKVGAVLFMSVPLAFYEAGIAYADLAMGFYVLLGVYAVLNWQETGNTRWLWVCALMGGFALGTKVLTAIPIVVMCLAVLLFSGRDRQWGRGLALAFGVGFGALVVGLVWYIKSYVYTDNPVYPFMYEIFGGKNWSPQAAATYKLEQSSFGMGKGMAELLILPWNLLANGFEFTNKQSANYFALVGPSILGLVPIYAMIGRLKRPVIVLAAVALASLLAWFVLMQHSRYLLMSIPLFILLAGAGVDAANQEWRVGRHVVNVFVAACLVPTIVVGTVIALSNFSAASGAISADEFLSKDQLDVYSAQKHINENLPRDSNIVMMDEVRGFYLDRDYIWGNPGHHETIPWSAFKTGDQMVRWFRDNGYTHMLINRKFSVMESEIHSRLIPEAIGRGRLYELHDSNGVSVYEFR